MVFDNLFGRNVASQLSDEYGVTVYKSKNDDGVTVRTFQGEEYVGREGWSRLVSVLSRGDYERNSDDASFVPVLLGVGVLLYGLWRYL